MGYPKLNSPDSVLPPRVSRPGADMISLTARRQTRPKSQPKPHISGADQKALARIAERFAPGAPGSPGTQSDAAPEEAAPKVASKDQPFDQKVPWSPILASASGMRTLIAVLIAVALLPSLTLGAMLWLGAIKTPWSTGAHAESVPSPAAKASLAATMPVPDRVQSKQVAAVGALALSAPDALDAEAGGETPFAVALDHAGALPARSVIAIAGLPHGATLSAGRPYGEAEWNLRTDEIGDLRIALPKAASGESKLRVKLVAADGEILAGTETTLKVAAASDPGANDSAQGQAPVPEHIYDPNLVDVAAWDGKTQQLLGASGVEEVFTTPDTPLAPPAHVLPSQDGDGDAKAWIAPEFVNLRKGPTSSAEVISVVAKGSKLEVMGRKRGWVKVTNPATSESGWVYAGSKTRRARADQSDAEGSFWPSWLSGG
ncbi:SH3 domain-containing protein [Methyloceanibacter sp.]|uniref:SH3 domain-containing protein n=1 Tax=Methyloceanibacter sp. TaxID=1965321 RepID=UPI003D6D83E8